MNKKQNSKEYLAPEELEKQEHLSLQIINQTIPHLNDALDITNRPSSNFIDLMDWTIARFAAPYLKNQKNLNKYVHNRIIIDGQFLQFCEENKISVKCLYKDSIISWKSNHDYEKFFMQGIFLIKDKGVEFLHAALFHKGHQNEDEISFFIICSDENYEKYISLRNKFDFWVQERDRSNLRIRVINAEDIPYTKDNSWDELFLPSEIKFKLKEMVENFLSSQDFYLEKKIPWKRGLLLYGQPGNGKTSIIRTIISEYNFKPVTIAAGANDDVVREAFVYAEKQSPSLLYFEDLDSLLEKIDASTFLNLMDGISTKNGMLVVATANEIKKLKPNITQRPSRFDRKFEIPLPNQKMAILYLKKWFGDIVSINKYKELAKYIEKNKFSYAYLKELYISSMFEALSNNRKTPTVSDIDNTLVRLLQEKNVLNDDRAVSTDDYFK